MTKTLSGPAWAEKFPTTRDPHDLAEPWRDKWLAFDHALTEAGAKIHYAAVYRPKERAYLMHWAWMIAHGGVRPDDVPSMDGVDIEWVHPGEDSEAASLAAAHQMVAAYGMAHVAALDSRHIERRAVDVSITWEGTLVLRLPSGSTATIPPNPSDGQNPLLWRVAAQHFDVHKLVKDPPHWSEDGH